MFRFLAALGCLGLAVGFAAAQTAYLGETTAAGDCFEVDLALNVTGKLKVDRGGRLEPLPLTAAAKHRFVERTDSPDARGAVGKVLRKYSEAKSESRTAGETAKRELAADRTLIVAQRTTAGTLHYCPDGPLTREELELTAEHFDTLCLPGLMPNKDVKVGDVWPVGPEATQQACLLDGLIKSDLNGTITTVTADAITFTIAGPVEGVENGAQAKIAVTATGKFSLVSKRLVALTWQQTDDRAQGPAGPAAEMTAIIALTRTPLTEEPKSLDAAARAKLPADDKATAAFTKLKFVDADGRFRFTYGRDWHIVGRTADHLVLRLLDEGDFTAQATLTVLKKLAPGGRTTPDEFKTMLAAIPNWAPETIVEDRTIPLTDAAKQLYRLSVRGKQDGAAVLQTFTLLSGPQGEQLAVTILTPPDKATKIAGRDLELLKAVDFGK